MLKVNLNVTFLDDELKEIKGYWRGGGGGGRKRVISSNFKWPLPRNSSSLTWLFFRGILNRNIYR